jgi:hypothetical protein
MNKRKILTIVALLLVSVVLVAAVPMAQSELVSLAIDNQTHDYVTFRLEGPQFYYLMVQPYTSATFTIRRGDYTIQKFYSCGTFVNTTIDFTKKQTIIVPKCGDKAYNTPMEFNPYIDAGKLIKLVKVTFENPYDYTLLLILKGPAEYVFTIEGGNSESYTIAQGDYEVTQYGCAYLKNFNFYPYANKVKELSCSTVY